MERWRQNHLLGAHTRPLHILKGSSWRCATWAVEAAVTKLNRIIPIPLLARVTQPETREILAGHIHTAYVKWLHPTHYLDVVYRSRTGRGKAKFLKIKSYCLQAFSKHINAWLVCRLGSSVFFDVMPSNLSFSDVSEYICHITRRHNPERIILHSHIRWELTEPSTNMCLLLYWAYITLAVVPPARIHHSQRLCLFFLKCIPWGCSISPMILPRSPQLCQNGGLSVLWMVDGGRQSRCAWSKIPWWKGMCDAVCCRDATASSLSPKFGSKSSHIFTQSP
jgi:hypothetical protein